MFGLAFANLSLSELDFVKLILIRIDFAVMWYMFENFYMKSDFDRISLFG